MKLSRSSIILIVTLLTLMLVLFAGVTVIVPRLLHLDNYREQIISAVQSSLHREVRYRTGKFEFHFGPSFTFSDVEIMEKDNSATFISAERLNFKIALLPLLRKQVVVTEMSLKKPRIQLSRDATGKFNIDDLLESRKDALSLQLHEIWMDKGSLQFTDQAASPEGIVTSLDHLDFFVNNLSRRKNITFKISCDVLGQAGPGSFVIGGLFNPAGKGNSFTESKVDLKILAKNLNANHFWPYYSKYVPFRKTLGKVDIDSSFKGKLAEFTSTGDFTISDLRFDYPQVFHAILSPKNIRCRYSLSLTPSDLAVSSLDLNVDGLKVKGSCTLQDIHSKDLRIIAKATTSPFRLEDFHQYIPYGIIVKGTADFIEQHVKGGLYRLDEGKLVGRISQIVHMEKNDNYNVLYIKGRVEKGLLTFGPDVPTFNSIKGELEMRGKDFNLHKMTANFGGSPFSMEGKIADYPLDTPSSYPFTMNMTPRRAEIAWLIGQEWGRKLVFNGDSKLQLQGEGFSTGYNITGNWDLTPADYSVTNLVIKPAHRSNQLTAKVFINNQELKVSSLQYQLAPMTLQISSGNHYPGKGPFRLDVKSNQFSISEVASLLPAVKKYQPAGRIRASVTGSARDNKTETPLRWNGEILFTDFSCKPSANISTITNINGIVTFNGDALQTSQLAVKLGKSSIFGRGTLTGFDNPEINLAFSAPTLDVAELGLKVPAQQELKIGKVQGNISLKDKNLQIKSLTGQVNNSTLAIKGNIQNLDNPKATLTLNSSYLEVEDILLLTELETIHKGKAQIVGPSVKAFVTASSGKVKNIPFEKLTATVIAEDKIVYLQPLEATSLGGHVSGKARLDFGSPLPRYQVSYMLDNISAESLTRSLGIKNQEIKGTISISGELTAKGKDIPELKRTSLGSAKIRCEEGSLRRFAVLSKIFSILNVSQLLKFQLPDMVSGGMPYNEITANLAIRDGVISSSDLYIDSDAMNISAVGTLDLVREELNVTIGVQPLQTIDKVVSRIPIVGWILTGKDKTLITAYFEAKGKIQDPVVTAIPVKGMAKGVFDIFKRVFQLPAKLITGTGEVIIGK